MSTVEPYMSESSDKSRQETLRDLARLRHRVADLEERCLEFNDRVTRTRECILRALRVLPEHLESSAALHEALAQLLRASEVANELRAASRATREPRTRQRKILEAWGHETILVVEDDDTVRNVVESWLNQQGYEVMVAATPDEAEAMFDRHGDEIDLLLADVVMPERSGPELYTRLRERKPTLRALFMSGYAGESIVRDAVLSADTPFIHKPFTPASLAIRIREVLNGEGEDPELGVPENAPNT